MKKLLALLMAVVMLLSFAACGSSESDEDEEGGKSSGKSGSLESAVNIIEEVMNGNMKNLKKLIPSSIWDTREEETENFDEQYEEYEEMYKDRADSLKEDYGENTEVELSIEDKEDMDDEELAKVKNSLEEDFDIDPDDVKAGCNFTLVTSYKNTDEDVENDEEEFAAVQIGSSWYLLNTYEIGDEYGVDFIA